jgi:hypothetical protein
MQRRQVTSCCGVAALAVLRKYARALEKKLEAANTSLPRIEDMGMSITLRYALNRKHQETRLFAICRQRTFVESTIDTQEFWKSKEAGRAFGVMYRESMLILKREFRPGSEEILVALVDDGGLKWAQHF